MALASRWEREKAKRIQIKRAADDVYTALELLQDGNTPEMIDEKIKEKRKREDEERSKERSRRKEQRRISAEEVGDESMERVARVVSRHPLVTEVTIMPKWSYEDAFGKTDVMVELYDGESIRIEVKSSEYYIEEFCEKLMRDNKLVNAEQLEAFLLNFGLMIMNGQLGEEVIAQQFEEQVSKIRNYKIGRDAAEKALAFLKEMKGEA